MKLSALFLALTIFTAGCVSSEKNSDTMQSYPNLVEIVLPDGNQAESKVYVDSVEHVTHKKSKALLVSGSFPDGCTKLKSASHKKSDDTISITLKAWRDPDSLCTQALTAFSFIYDKLDESDIEQLDSVSINSRSYQVQ